MNSATGWCQVSEGDVRWAIRVLCSNDGVAIPDHARLMELELLHPPALPNRWPTPVSSVAPLSTTPAAVYAAGMAFPSGSVGGPDGLRPQHLKDLLIGGGRGEGGGMRGEVRRGWRMKEEDYG